MISKAKSPAEYLNEVPSDRLVAVEKLRNTILENLPIGFEEGMSYGMIGYYVPHSIYPNGYHCDTKLPLPFMSFASQKNSINFYHMGITRIKIFMNGLFQNIQFFQKRSSILEKVVCVLKEKKTFRIN